MKMTCTIPGLPKVTTVKNTAFQFQRNLKGILFVFIMLFFSSLSSIGQISITSTGTAVTQNFDAMLGTTAAATLTANQWRVGDNSTAVTWAGGTRTATTQLGGTAAAVSAGGIYNYGNGTAATATDRALGFLSSGTNPFTSISTTPMNIYAQYVNNTGSILGQISGSFDVEKYRGGTNAAGWSMNFYYSLNGTTWVNVTSGNQVYAADAGNTAVAPAGTSSKTFSVTGLSIATSATFYLRWAYFATSGTVGTNAQGIAIDNISLTAATSIVAPTVSTTTPASSITTTAATLGGSISSNGGGTITASGIVWSVTATNNNPLLSGSGVTNEATSPVTTTGSFTKITSASLSPNIQYSFKGYATNSQGTGYGSVATFYTLANTPNPPVASNPSSNSIDIALGSADGNPITTEYSINETGTFLFLQADGTLGATETWQDAATWASTTTVFGLSANTTYTFKVRARNGAGMPTNYSSTASATTLPTGDPTATLTASPSLTEANLDGSTFAITLTNDNFSTFISNPTSLPVGSFTLNNAGGATITSVIATSSTTAIVTLAFSGDFDAILSSFNVDIDGAQLASASLLTSSSLSVTALDETISVSGSIGDVGSVCTGSFSTVTSYTVSGTDLRNDIILTAPAGFEISLNNSPFASASPIHLVPSANTVGSTLIYVRFAPTVTGLTGTLNISAASTGATTQNTVVSGTGINTPPAIGSPTSASVTGTTATLGGTVTSIGCASVIERGIYWSTTNGFADGAGTKLSETGTFAAGLFTVNVTLLPSGTIIYYKAFASNSNGTAYTSQATFTTTKAEPSQHPAAFACGTTTSLSIPLSWVDGAGAQAPDGYLIKWSTVNFASVTDPVDGSTSNGANSTTVNQGVQSASVAGLSSNTTYYFKIYSYTNSGSSINYKTDGSIQQTTCTTQLAACYTSSGASVNWNFTALTAVASTTTPNVTVSDFISGNNNTAPASFINATSPSSTYAGFTAGGNAGAATFTGAFNSGTSTYFAFTVTPSAGYAITVSGLNFGSRSTTTGPTSYSIRSSADNYGTDLGTGTMPNTSTWQLKANTLSLSGTPGTAVTFRIYGFAGSGSASVATANWRVDDIALSLTVTNAPSLATVGSNQSVCEDVTIVSNSLGGNTPTLGTGTWSQVSGSGTSTFSAVNSGSSTATASVTGTYVYRWSINNGCATTNTADITVNYLPKPAAPSITPGGSIVFCTGGSVILTSTAAFAYQWYSANASLTILTPLAGQTNQAYTASTDGYYVAAVYSAAGCISDISNVIHVVVNPNYSISSSAGLNGSISPNGSTTVCSGANQAFTITPNSGYLISNITVDGTPATPLTTGTYATGGTYLFSNVITNHTITASFVLSCTNVSLASASATATPICSDATTTLTYTDLAGTGASVTWYDGTGGTGNTYGTGTPSSSVSPGTYYAYATGTCGTPVEIQVVVGSTPLTTITVAAAPTSQTVYINDPSPANLTVTATGASLTYQWFSNGSNSNAGGTSVGAGSGGQTNTYTPPTNVLGTKYYYVVVTGTCGTQTSSAVAVTITNTNTWKQGNATTNWSLASNWTGNAVPTGANDAAIPVGNTPYPALTAAASINNLIIDPTATVSLNGFTLTINGTVTGTGTLSGSATSNLITSSSTTLLFTSGSNTLKNLNVNSGTLTLGNALNITGGTAANTYGTVTVATGATLASGGNLTIQSNQFGTARVAAGDAAGNYITGDVTVERYIPANSKRSWRLLSVPTKGTKTIKQTWQENQAPLANGTPGFGTLITSNIATTAASQAAGFDAFSQLPSMQSYNSGTQGWVYVTSTNSAPIQTNKGYFLYIRGDRSVTTSSSTDAAGATVLRTTGTLYQGNSNPAVSIAAGKFEPVGNTFASAVDFSGLAKTGGISNTFYVWDSKLLSGTTLGAYQTFNGAIGFTPATPGGSYPSGVPNTSIESGEAIMLGAVGSAGTVALVESSKIAGNEFTPFRPSALPAQFKTSLLKVTGSTTVFADNNIVVFDRAYANVVDANDALKIQKAGETMSIVTDSKSLIVDARQPVAPGDVIRFNMGNLQPQAYKLSFTTQNMNTTGLTAFVEDKYLYSSTAINLDAVSDYTFTVDAANAASSAKDRFSVVFKKVGAAAIAVVQPVFVISPNPVEGGVVNVEFKNQVAGKYGIRLLDAGGAVIFSTFATHGGGTGSQRLSLPSGISRGSYQLEITAPGKSRELQTLFIHTSK